MDKPTNQDRQVHIELTHDDVQALLDALSRARADIRTDLKAADTLDNAGMDSSVLRAEVESDQERFWAVHEKLAVAKHDGVLA